MTTNPNTIIEKIKEEAEQKVLVSLNLFASAIDLHGYTPANHRGFTKRIVEDFMELLALVQSSERTKSEKACYEKGLNDMYDAAVWASWNYEGVNLREAFKLSLNDKKRKFINGNVENKSKEVRASSEVNPGESKGDA
jgi:hypothetical protein